MIHRWAMIGLGVVLFSAAAAAQPAPTVNSYTPAQADQALAAARAAGYTGSNVITFAQAGNFFINASRDGQKYSLTVTPDGKVYASQPTPPRQPVSGGQICRQPSRLQKRETP